MDEFEDGPRTKCGMTVTREGDIPHLRHPESGIEMPVKTRTRDVRELPEPIHYKGALVYALPDGGEFIDYPAVAEKEAA